MSRNYDNWERLVAAVLKKEELWQLFHEQSRSPSLSSESSSGFSFSFSFSSHLNSSLDDIPIGFTSPRFSSIVDEDQSPVKNVSSTRSRKRHLKIEVPNLPVLDQGAFSHAPSILEHCLNTSVTPISKAHPKANWPDSPNRQSYPLPLPPVTNSNSSPVSRHNSAATSPSTPLRSPERAENVASPVSPWKKGKFISRGAFGNVYTGFNSETGEMCAMKEVTLFGDDAKSKQSAMQLGKQLESEIVLLSSLKHPNLVQYYGSETLGDNFYIYLEYVSGGSIYSILQQYGRLGESAIRSYTQQILSGLAYLHSKSIAHRDIKGANILVDPNGSVKLANFGIAKHIEDDSSLLPASPYWMAPEVIMNSNVRNRAVDIWSLGCTVLEMATSIPPISQYEWMVSMFKAGNHKDFPIIPDHLSDEGKDFVRCCLQWNPVHRATASQLLEHPFVKNVIPLQNPLPLEKRVFASKHSGRPASTNAVRSQILHQLDSGRVTIRSSALPSNYNFHPGDIYTPRNISAPVSPIGSPLPHPRSPHLNYKQSPPHISSSHNPSTRGINAIPYHHLNNPSPNVPNHRPIITSPSYWDPNILRGPQTKSHPSHKLQSRENNTRGNNLISTANQQLVLADRVSKKLLNAL